MTKITATLFLLFVSVFMFAQDKSDYKGEENRDKIKQKMEAKKIAFISDELELTPADAQKFWPLYNGFQDEMKALGPQHKKMKSSDNEEIDYSQALTDMINDDSKRIAIKKSYIDKFSQAIGPEKTFRFFNIERRFKKEMLEGLKRRKRFEKSDKEKRKFMEGKD